MPDAWLATNAAPLVTTDYVIDALMTLRKMRGEYQRALRLGARLFAGAIARLVGVVPDDVQEAWTIFQRYQDKGRSFTDCGSRVIMQRLAMQTACAFDEDFRQFGTVTVVP